MTTSHRTAIVTGASRGLGTVIARVLAGRGFDLVIGARGERRLTDVARALATFGTRVTTVPGDVTDPRVRAALVDAARQFGSLHVLVNNASELGAIRPIAALDPAELARVLDVNVIAPVALSGLAVPLLAPNRGQIVNISSDAARGAYPRWAGYGASKAALELVTLTLAKELLDQGISVVAVDPGDMRTAMHQDAFPGEDISDRPLPDVTAPFWQWLFDQDPDRVNGERFAAQQEDERWLHRV